MRQTILYGSAGEPIRMTYDDGLKQYSTERPFEGVLPNMERRFRETDSAWVREELGRYQNARTCEVCGGARLKPEALAVKVARQQHQRGGALSIAAACDWFAGVSETLTPASQEIAARILKEINERLGFLRNVGLEYLTLARASGTLSGGESQRIRLASQIGSGLTGVLYVLDEPSIGLHQRDNARLLGNAEAAARPRQHGHRRRARRGGDPHRRLARRYGAGRRRAWRPPRRRGHARRGDAPPRQHHRAVPDRRAADRGAGDAAARATRGRSCG